MGEARVELRCDHLEEPLGFGQILEAVLAKVFELDTGVQNAAGLRRDQNLASVTCRADARRAVHVDAHVALRRYRRLARVDAHTDSQRTAPERSLRLTRRGHRIRGV